MTPEQLAMARSLYTVTMVPGIPTKRFARQMRELAEHKPEANLSKKQDSYLRMACVRFRRQLPAEVVTLARAGLTAEERSLVLVQPIPKENAWRSEPYRRLVASFACEHCSLQGFSQFAHGDFTKGMGIKTDDRTGYAACCDRPHRVGCHTLIGSSGRFSRDQRRVLERRYANQTIARVCRMGLWAQFRVALPPWYHEGWGILR